MISSCGVAAPNGIDCFDIRAHKVVAHSGLVVVESHMQSSN